MNTKKIVVGLSGGVDSAIAAYLLKKEGYEVIGVTLALHDGAVKEAADAARVAECLSIEHRIIDQKGLFEDTIISYFQEAYFQGETPNPCMLCNPKIKWRTLLSEADKLSAGEVATGHYAGVVKLSNGRFSIQCAASQAKDQAYVLYGLSQEQLSRTRMPLTNFKKEEVRALAKELSLPVAEKADSMEICFLPKGEVYTEFLRKTAKTPVPEGNFIDENGKILGKHLGIPFYTVGQRKGLGIAFGEPRYVKELRPETNEVVLSGNAELFQTLVYAKGYLGMGEEELVEGKRYFAKLRYSHKGAFCTVTKQKDRLCCVFEEPQRAATPGQAIVFFDQEIIAGGAVICR